MQSDELRKRFLNYFEKNGHKIIKSSSLLPSDPSVLFTTAGMQQLAPYLEGKVDVIKDFGSRHLCDVQKCFRTNDIEEVGDDTHHTFFEMLGNWSIGTDDNGNYFKEGAIKYALDFLVNEIGLEKDKMYATVFEGENGISKDTEAIELWKQNGIPEERIIPCGSENNFWGPTSQTGPCGPCSEIHYDRGQNYGCGKKSCGPNCPDCKRFVEVWNLVFMQYRKDESGNFVKLNQTNIDTGTGFERMLCIINKVDSAYETDLFDDIIKEIQELSGKQYNDYQKEFRIIADHSRSACFLIADGVMPSNVGQGYVLRRILRRAIRYGQMLGCNQGFLIPLSDIVIKKYKTIYPELGKQEEIITVISHEEEKFYKALQNGLKEFAKLSGQITAKQAFDLYQTYGLPIEIIEEEAKSRNLELDLKGLQDEISKHQEVSRAGASNLFGGHGANDVQDEAIKYQITKLHTATHLLQSALRKVLGDKVGQQGSNITIERLRFDFSFDRKMTPEEIRQVQDLVNDMIKQDLPVIKEDLPYQEAINSGALAFFREKYPEIVSVYSIGSFSKELCGGPHVQHTGELGEFVIQKEEASSAGVRRIKAILK
ncbi:alanine--tRNA ligase [Candidatus Parcubacteria bacterium]|nr:alanine--tRNA ligase [Candidatus Parcubacteria bacterium]